MNWRDHIVSDPEVIAGKPVVKGTRLPVDLIFDRLGDRWTLDELFESYPGLTPGAVQAAFAFAAEILRDEDCAARAKAAA